jgi:response regulator RpfG family c-di-GMP phosphodiesterase
MPGWAIWSLVGVGAWAMASLVVGLLFSRMTALFGHEPHETLDTAELARLLERRALSLARPQLERSEETLTPPRARILLVDDDPGLRLLLRTTLAADECRVEEAGSAEEAADLARFWRPTLVVLDVALPGLSGLAFCDELKQKPVYGFPRVILLTGGETSRAEALAVGADTLLRKPFSPLDLLGAIDHVLDGGPGEPSFDDAASSDQLLAYAEDLNEIVHVERAQRRLVQHAYRQTISALADALEAKSSATGRHALRVQRYALELTEAVDPGLLDDPSLEYGFLLHDIGKIGIPDAILEKAGPLSPGEVRTMQRHPVIGAELLAEVPLLAGAGFDVVRSHHERWDGRGYPDGLRGDSIPLGARLFAVADALDAMTSERPYRHPMSWEGAVDEILRENGTQFDPQVVAAFARREQRLHRTQLDLAHIA